VHPVLLIPKFLRNVRVVVSLDSGMELHDAAQHLNRFPVQVNQVVLRTLIFININQRIGPVEIADELF
jgi:hypothetical protein